MKPDKTKLSHHITPHRYELHPHTAGHRLVISLTKHGRPSHRICLHQTGLSVTAAKLTYHSKRGDSALTVSTISHLPTRHQVRIKTHEPLYAGRYTLMIHFVTKTPVSFDTIDVEFSDGTNRRHFPCIDEPDAQADIHINNE